jgi:hypothetical protein
MLHGIGEVPIERDQGARLHYVRHATTRCLTWTSRCRPSMGQHQNELTRQWANKIASFGGFVIVTPEYNHSTSGC